MALLALLPGSPANREAISRDSGVFLYTGWRVLEGEIPYRDVWDHKTPGIFYLNALGLALEPDTLWGVWGLEFALVALAGLVLFALLSRLWGTGSALLALLLGFFALSEMQAGGNLTQIQALPFQAGGLWFAYQSTQQPGIGRNWFWLGVLAACTVWFRQNSIGVFIAIALWMLIYGLRQRSLPELWNGLVHGLAGVLVASLPVLVYFAVHSALVPLWDAAFAFNFYYTSEGGWRDRLEALLSGLQTLGQSGVLFAMLAGWLLAISAWWKKQAKDKTAAFLQYLCLALAIEVALVVMGGRPRVPYFISLLPVAIPLMAYGFARIGQFLTVKTSPRIAQVVAGIFVLTALLYMALNYQETLRASHSLTGPEDVTAFIQHNTTPEETVLLVGAETSVNFEARRESPTRFVYQYPLYRQAYAQPEHLEEFFADILARRPALIILATGDSEMPNRFGGSKTARSEALAFQINEIYQVVAEFENGWVALAPLDD